jgi:hypothetical protein
MVLQEKNPKSAYGNGIESQNSYNLRINVS